MYVTTEENTSSRMKPTDKEPDLKIGQTRIGGNFTPLNDAPNPGVGGGIRAPVITNGTETNGTGAVSAIDPRTGVTKWKFPFTNISNSGLLTTASDLVFSGSREGHFFALDARTGSELWRANLGGHVNAAPMTYAVDGKQFVRYCRQIVAKAGRPLGVSHEQLEFKIGTLNGDVLAA